MSTYLATTNVPGYLPVDDDPPTFDTAEAAWEYLADRRRDGEDDALEDGAQDGGYSSCKNVLDALARGEMWEDHGVDPITGEGTVYGPTPGGAISDLGLAYSVTLVPLRYVAHFQPEAWVNNYAIAVDDEGEDTWDVTDAVAAIWDEPFDLDETRTDDDDVLKTHPGAPAWVRDWSGPFTIEVQAVRAEQARS